MIGTVKSNGAKKISRKNDSEVGNERLQKENNTIRKRRRYYESYDENEGSF